jgi:23S rRNA pseudouridine1911/1915/1917 synthase
MDIKIIYEDENLMVVDKPAGLVVFPEGQPKSDTVIDYLTEKYPELKNAGEGPRYGIVHRLDKDTSGILLVAKSTEALIFLQKEFINRRVEKKYVCLAEGALKNDFGRIETLIGRSKSDPRKQKVYFKTGDHPAGAREAATEYTVLERYKDYTLLEVKIETGRRHQIRCHLSYLRHPIAGDKLYGFKNSKTPEGLTRQFLHATYLKIKIPTGSIKEFQSSLPEEFKNILNKLEK